MNTHEQSLTAWIDEVANQRTTLGYDDWPAEVLTVLTIDTGSLLGALGAYR